MTGNNDNEEQKPKPKRKRAVKCHAKQVAMSLLESLGCTADWEDNNSIGSHTANFMFQGGHFILNVWDRHNHAQLLFPGVYEADADDLDVVRSAINSTNMGSIFTHVVMNFSETQGNIHCHVCCHLLLEDDTEPFRNAFYDALMANFHVREDLAKYINEAKEKDDDDPELSDANFRREMYLTSMQAWEHTEEHVRLSSQCQATFTLREMLRRLFDWQDASVATLRIVHDMDITMQSDASEYIVLDALFDEQGRVVHDDAVLIMTVIRDELQFKDEPSLYPQRRPMTVTATMHVTYTDEIATYVQVTLAREAAVNGDIRTLQHPEQKGDAVTFLLGYDRQSDKERHDEYKFMLADAQQKVRAGEGSQLSHTQEILMANDDEYSVGYNVYWGEEYVRKCRYAEALVHFVSAYEQLSPRSLLMNRRQRMHFLYISYMTGLCYARLRQKEKAFYYLDAAAFANKTPYTLELINLLVNASDIRADIVINNVMNITQEAINEGDDDTDVETMQPFVRFLNSRRAYLYIEQHNWEAAESILNNMLQEPELHDFALNELAYLATLREQEKRDKAAEKKKR